MALTSQECHFEKKIENIFQNASALFTQPKVILVTRTKNANADNADDNNGLKNQLKCRWQRKFFTKICDQCRPINEQMTLELLIFSESNQ